MATTPQPRYARAGDAHVAYQIDGAGTVDLVLLPDGFMTIEAIAELPAYARFRDRLASFSRLITLDHRGLGLSDPVTPGTNPSLEHWAEDLRAVMDAADSSHAALLGIAEGGFGAAFYAATHPDRVSHLILVNATPCVTEEPFAAWGIGPGMMHVLESSADHDWGANTSPVPVFAPSGTDDPAYHAWLTRSFRRAASPAVAKSLFDLQLRSDIRHILPSIRVPTLVIHRTRNRWFSPEHGRYLAEHITGARYLELPGDDHVPYFGDSEAIADEIEEFVTGTRRAGETDRVLATVLFTDIVTSTDRAAEIGDARWLDVLDRHDEMCRAEVGRQRGILIKSTGDGILARFDGPGRAVTCAQRLNEQVAALGLQIRSGAHTGEVELRGDDLGGIAVHIAARVMSHAQPGEILVSRTVKDLTAGAGLTFIDRGEQTLKGIPEPWRLYAIAG
jgi:class 3 adenylate cyclase/pimeloyl-ACP methyl ester carboxylesterase